VRLLARRKTARRFCFREIDMIVEEANLAGAIKSDLMRTTAAGRMHRRKILVAVEGNLNRLPSGFCQPRRFNRLRNGALAAESAAYIWGDNPHLLVGNFIARAISCWLGKGVCVEMKTVILSPSSLAHAVCVSMEA